MQCKKCFWVKLSFLFFGHQLLVESSKYFFYVCTMALTCYLTKCNLALICAWHKLSLLHLCYNCLFLRDDISVHFSLQLYRIWSNSFRDIRNFQRNTLNCRGNNFAANAKKSTPKRHFLDKLLYRTKNKALELTSDKRSILNLIRPSARVL